MRKLITIWLVLGLAVRTALMGSPVREAKLAKPVKPAKKHYPPRRDEFMREAALRREMMRRS